MLLVKSGDHDGHAMKSGVLDGHITEKPRTYLSLTKTRKHVGRTGWVLTAHVSVVWTKSSKQRSKLLRNFIITGYRPNLVADCTEKGSTSVTFSERPQTPNISTGNLSQYLIRKRDKYAKNRSNRLPTPCCFLNQRLVGISEGNSY